MSCPGRNQYLFADWWAEPLPVHFELLLSLNDYDKFIPVMQGRRPPENEWDERILADVLQDLGINYIDGPGEAAFYGPKIDIQFPTVTGRDEIRW